MKQVKGISPFPSSMFCTACRERYGSYFCSGCAQSFCEACIHEVKNVQGWTHALCYACWLRSQQVGRS